MMKGKIAWCEERMNGTSYKEGERRTPGVRKEKEGRGSRAPDMRRGEEVQRV